MKRLREVIVATGFETAHAVVCGVLHREEQDGCLDALTAQLRTQLEAVHGRHHHIEHDEVERLRA
jgi:hypothetical protein